MSQSRSEYRKADRKRRRKLIRELIDDTKNAGRCTCGECNNDLLTFHHRNPGDKLFDIGSGGRYTMRKVRIEIAKCDLICRDCHDKLHDMVRKN